MSEYTAHRKQTPDEVLAQIAATRIPRPQFDNEFVPARTSTEKLLVSCCEEVLGYAALGVEDNFIRLGGDSLQMARVMVRVRQTLGIDLTFDDFFSSNTLADLARLIDERHGGKPVSSS